MLSPAWTELSAASSCAWLATRMSEARAAADALTSAARNTGERRRIFGMQNRFSRFRKPTRRDAELSKTIQVSGGRNDRLAALPVLVLFLGLVIRVGWGIGGLHHDAAGSAAAV